MASAPSIAAPSASPSLTLAERRAVLFLSFLVWALLAASAFFWIWASPRQQAPVSATSVTPALQGDPAQVARLLHQTEAVATVQTASPLASRMQLRGVAMQAAGTGVVILVVDGQPAKPYRTGDEVADGWIVQSLALRSATLANGNQSLVIELPEQATQTDPDTSALPPAHALPPQAVAPVPAPVYAPPPVTVAPSPAQPAPPTVSPNTPLQDPAIGAPPIHAPPSHRPGAGGFGGAQPSTP
ncbi:MAG: hypothetical protein Q4G39_07045 [Brachymonas sp.]|nr:hypothetical protein [Brachymonas sp.]